MRLPALLALLALPVHAMAIEGRIDFYGTGFRSDDAELTLERRDLFAGTTRASAEFAGGADDEFGVRALAWGDRLPWVLGLDIGYFRTDSCCMDLHVVPVTLIGGWRAHAPLLARDGHGLHPYALAGITAASIDGDARLGTIATDITSGSNFLLSSGNDPDLSPYLAVGVEWDLSARIGLVAEYRYQSFTFDSISSNSLVFPTSNTLADGRLDVPGISIGISWLPAPPASP